MSTSGIGPISGYDAWKSDNGPYEGNREAERLRERMDEVKAMLKQATDGFDPDIAEFTCHGTSLSVEVPVDLENDNPTILGFLAIDLRTAADRLDRKRMELEMKR